jgi:hypothetical protein
MWATSELFVDGSGGCGDSADLLTAPGCQVAASPVAQVGVVKAPGGKSRV